MITNIVAYTDKFDSVCNSAKDKIIDEGIVEELSPDNTVGDLLLVITERLFREFAGDYWDMTLGELYSLSEEDQEKVFETVFGDGEWSQEFVPKK